MKDIVEANKHIPTEEIKRDIADTLAEIRQMEKEAEHLEATPMGMRETRWNQMRAKSRRSGIQERKEFVERLEVILKSREVEHH